MSAYSVGYPDTWTTVAGNVYGGVYMAVAALDDGSVLICGGRRSGNIGSSRAWTYHDGAVTPTYTNMTAVRWGHTATKLPDGRVLVAGSAVPKDTDCQTAELYDPKSRSFTATGTMCQSRGHHTATLLPTGQVLLAGGWDCNGVHLASAELYDPGSGQFTPVTSSMQESRIRHTATAVDAGRVLLVSGCTADLYDSATGKFATTAGPKVSRVWHAAVRLPGGSVLIGGGYASGQGPEALEEVWSPNGTIAYTRNPLGDGALDLTHYGASLTPLPSGKVLAVGGSSYANPDQSSPSISGTARLYDPDTGCFTTVPTAALERAFHCAVPLLTGQVLVVGGVTRGAGVNYLDTVQAYCPNPPPLLLHVELIGTGRGSVRSSPPGIDTTGSDSAWFAPDMRVTLNATPGPRRIVPAKGPIVRGRPKPATVISNRFDGWSKDATGPRSTCALVLDREKTAAATFTQVSGTVVTKPPIRVP